MRQVNAEEAVIPLRTVVVLIAVVLSVSAGAVGLAWSAKGQWDDTQRDIRDLKNQVIVFNQTVIDKGKARDEQLKAIGNQFGDVNGRIDTLRKIVTDLATAQDGAHDETMKKIASVEATAANAAAQAQAAAQQIARFKCIVKPKDCAPTP